MVVSLSTSGLKQSKWYEYLIRFVLGGLVTAGAGVLSNKIGPSFGGLFLAFPAILTASTTLVEKHERERKEKKGLQGKYRGRHAAGADAAGAAMGSLGLIAFAWFVCRLIAGHNPAMVIGVATMIWVLVSAATWWVWKRNWPHRLRRASVALFSHKRDEVRQYSPKK
jgi:hypothetical protein